MNHQCWGTSFERWGKQWLWCAMDGQITESPKGPFAICPKCGRQWYPVPATAAEIKRIMPDIEQFIDFPYYKTRAAELEMREKSLREAAEWALRGLEKLAKEEAERKGTTFEMCDYSFAKGLRAALAGRSVTA